MYNLNAARKEITYHNITSHLQIQNEDIADVLSSMDAEKRVSPI